MSDPKDKSIKRPFKALGTPLPKVPLRPFWCMPNRMDDREYIETSSDDKKFMLFLPVVLIYGGGGFCLAGWTISMLANDPYWFMLLGGLTLLAFAGWAHLKLRRMKVTRFVVFDREKGVRRTQVGIFKKSILEVPFSECEGRLSRSPGASGAPGHRLVLYGPKIGPLYLDESITGIDMPLAYWSFLVQYMDKTKLLPDVPWLRDYPNRAKGWGTMEEWEELKGEPDFIDPFYEWEAIIKKNPKLDSNYYMEHPEELAQWNGKPPWSMNGDELVAAGIISPSLLPPEEQIRYKVPKLRWKEHFGKKSPGSRQQKLKEEKTSIEADSWAVLEKRGDFES